MGIVGKHRQTACTRIEEAAVTGSSSVWSPGRNNCFVGGSVAGQWSVMPDHVFKGPLGKDCYLVQGQNHSEALC